MAHDTEAAEEKYGKNSWSEVEKLVLYRLDGCEDNICSVKDDLTVLTEKRDKDVKNSRVQRTEQYENLQKALQDIKDTFAAAALKRAESGKLRVEKDATLRLEQIKIEGRLQRLERVVYGSLGAVGLFVLRTVLEGIF